jgi:hypothetical protein
MPGIVAYGAYVPYYRLQRGAIGAALGSGGGKGTRAVASFDEDATSMGVEAARIAMKAAGGIAPQVLVFATTAPLYQDRSPPRSRGTRHARRDVGVRRRRLAARRSPYRMGANSPAARGDGGYAHRLA